VAESVAFASSAKRVAISGIADENFCSDWRRYDGREVVSRGNCVERELLARIISAPDGVSPGVHADHVGGLLEVAMAEGVVAIANRRLDADLTVPADVRDEFAAAARALAAAHLALEAEARRVLAGLHAAGISVVVLKGMALGHWLFPAAYLRESSDIDLLFATRVDAESAAAALAPLGYAVLYSPGDMAHEFPCRRVSPGREVDLDMHWRLANMPLLRDLLSFQELFAASIPLPRLAEHARGLSPVHAFAHACIHRASNLCAGLGDRLKWLYDLHLLAGAFAPADWDELLDLCVERGMCGICAEGINASLGLFGTVVPERVLDALRVARADESLDASRLSDWRHMQRRNLAALPTLRERVRWLWQRAFPTRGYLRELYGTDVSVLALWGQRLKRAVRRLRS
jgi:hypothetical protein